MSNQAKSATDQDQHLGAQAESAPSAELDFEPENEGHRAIARRQLIGNAIAVLALAVALIALAVGAALWRRGSDLRDQLAAAAAERAQQAQRQQAGESVLEQRLALLEQTSGQRQQRVDELAQLLAPVPADLAQLQRRLEEIQGTSVDARTNWLRAEAEYYLALANTELVLAGRWTTAEAALAVADGRLRALGDPAVARVRSLIADELLALRATALPDVEGLSFSIGRLAERANTLPMRGTEPSGYADPDSPTEEAGLARLWGSISNALSSIIRVERNDAVTPATLTIEERQIVRRQLEAELQLARLGLIQEQQAIFSSAVANARRILERDFDRSSPDVGGALTLLAELADVTVAPPRPDISGSLRVLRGLDFGSD